MRIVWHLVCAVFFVTWMCKSVSYCIDDGKSDQRQECDRRIECLMKFFRWSLGICYRMREDLKKNFGEKKHKNMFNSIQSKNNVWLSSTCSDLQCWITHSLEGIGFRTFSTLKAPSSKSLSQPTKCCSLQCSFQKLKYFLQCSSKFDFRRRNHPPAATVVP